jgi:phosphoglycolate phosphatase
LKIKQIKADYLFFDLDGVILNSSRAIANSINYALEGVGLKRRPRNELYHLIGTPLNQIFSKLLPAEKLYLLKRCVALYRRRYREKCIEETSLYAGVRKTLSKLQHKRLVVVTIKPSFFSRTLLKAFAIDKYFYLLFGSTLSGKDQTKEELIRLALGKIKSRSAVMIGDTKNDIRGARANNLPSIAVTYGFGQKNDLLQATAIIDDISELPRIIRG